MVNIFKINYTCKRNVVSKGRLRTFIGTFRTMLSFNLCFGMMCIVEVSSAPGIKETIINGLSFSAHSKTQPAKKFTWRKKFTWTFWKFTWTFFSSRELFENLPEFFSKLFVTAILCSELLYLIVMEFFVGFISSSICISTGVGSKNENF